MIKCIIIDDEPLAIDLLKDYVTKAEGFELVGTFTNPIEALQQVESLDVDLIFLDVQMPELNGIQFLKIKKITNFFLNILKKNILNFEKNH
jgi:two-component SAPR family response regulator